MKRVYLLGSGALNHLRFNIYTRHIGTPAEISIYLESGPLSNGYFYNINKLIHSLSKQVKILPEVAISDSTFEYLCKYYKYKHGDSITKDEVMEKEEIGRNINIEDFYCYLEKEIEQIENNGIGNELLKIVMAKRELDDYIVYTLSLIGHYCFSIYHKIMAEHIISKGGDVISFNWDILLDEELQYTNKWAYENGYKVFFGEVLDFRGEPVTKNDLFNSVNFIIKPHGSINWYKKIEDDGKLYLFYPLPRPLRGGAFPALRKIMPGRDTYYTSAFVPPGEKRDIYPELWTKVKELLQNADEIIAIGLALNNYDKYMKGKFKDINFKSGLKINVINPDTEVKKNYEQVFKTTNITLPFSTFREYCQSIVRDSDMQHLSSLI